ncbi:hypothetical protein B0H17DRAFT_124822 [Mycena rosella]|uniref:Uncharacterized protein n=1 Tax=Mycena rosella TaxID=1033263 RepID=A0AAD7GAQ9_MYCRO|nr:hypothetical protein B0H17DRAFT_124822 [Mycena rosella]
MHLSANVHCAPCDLYFTDAEARAAHIESSATHPLCETCARHFLNENALSFHLKCAAPHLSFEDQEEEAEEEVLDGDEILLRWTSDIAEHISYFSIPAPEDDGYWSSEDDADTNSLTSDWGNELDSDSDGESHKFDNDWTVDIVFAGAEVAPEYRDLKIEIVNLVNSSEIRESCNCPMTAKSDSEVTA